LWDAGLSLWPGLGEERSLVPYTTSYVKSIIIACHFLNFLVSKTWSLLLLLIRERKEETRQ
jgi:hypothetical protein